MKSKVLVLALWLIAQISQGALSFLPATNEVNVIIQAHSFDTTPNVIWGDAIASYVACMYPQYTNHVWSWSHSGTSLEGDFENDEARRTMPFFHAVDTNLVAWDLFMAGDDNGAYTSNGIVQWWTNIIQGPNQVWNGTTLTNEGLTFPTVYHLPAGGPPEDNPSGASILQFDRNNACTNLAAIEGVTMLDTLHDLLTNGVLADINGPRLFGFFPGNHPYPAGYLCMALQHLIALGAETNIGACVIDFNAALVRSTNQMIISGLQLTGNTLTWTNHFNRMPGAWDVGAGTNGCDDTFKLMPYLADAFQWTIQVTNMPAGNYRLSIDGSNVVTLSSAQLASGWNMFAVTNGPLWNQRKAVLNAKRDQEGNDHVTRAPTHGAGDAGLGGNLDLINYISFSTFYPQTYTGTNFIKIMASCITGMKALDLLIHNATLQTNHVFTISPAGQTITFPSPGNQIYGVSPLTLGATASSGLMVVYNVTSGPATVSGNVLTITGAGSVTIQATQPGDATWPAAVPVSRTITVSQKTLAASITANNKTYDAGTAATIATRGLTGVVGADSVTLSGGSAAFTDKTVGIGKTVTATGLSLVGTDVAKYVLASTSATTTANITSAAVTVTGVAVADKVYNGTTSATVSTNNAVLLGIIGTDAVTLSGTATGTFADSNVGIGITVAVSGLTLSGADAGNYQLTQPSATASITKAATLNTVASSQNPAPPGSNLTFTSALSAAPPGGGVPAGKIIFKDGTTCLGTNALNGSAMAFFNTSALSSHGNHTIIAEYRGDGNFFGSTNTLNQAIDAQPLASSALLQRYATSGVKIRSSQLLTNDTDPDGDTLRLISISATSASGGTITTNGDWISYQPPVGFTNSDSFSRIIADSFGFQATGTVSVVVIPDTNASQNFAPAPPGFGQNLSAIRFYGIPQRVYTIQYTTNAATQDWQTLGTATANRVGFILFFDDPPDDSPTRFYRTTYP